MENKDCTKRTPASDTCPTRHAFLIIAHHEPEVLRLLLTLLDDERNDIFLHVDGRAGWLADRFRTWKPAHAGFRLLPQPIDVYWGDISQVRTELLLFETARRTGPYAYYHLLSGVDLPLRDMDSLHKFFTIHAGKEFVNITDTPYERADIRRKVGYYYLFTRHFRDRGTMEHNVCSFLRNVVLAVQKVVRFRRRPWLEFRKGANWVSISDDFCAFLLEHASEMVRRYAKTKCADEIFLQTLLWNSPFRERLYRLPDGRTGNLRAIDWVRGAPYTWRDEDFDELMQSQAFFCRKIGGVTDSSSDGFTQPLPVSTNVCHGKTRRPMSERLPACA